MAKQYFSANEYHSDPEALRSEIRRYPRSKLYFISEFMKVVFRSRRLALAGSYDNEAWSSSSMDIFNIIERTGGLFHISGIDNIRKTEGPVVFIGNHMSTLETMILPVLIQPIKDVTFVVKDSLVKHRLFGPIMRSRDPIVVSRTNSREDLSLVLSRGSELLGQGRSVIIFPQSTRRDYFNPAEFNTLGIKLASRNGVPFIPIALRTDFWGNGRVVKDLGPINRDIPINFVFGDSGMVTGSGKEEHNSIIRFITGNLEQWGATIVS